MLATNETDYTLGKVLRFVEAEERGKFSLSESKLFDTVAGMSGFKRQQGEVAKQNEVIPPKSVTRTNRKVGSLRGILKTMLVMTPMMFGFVIVTLPSKPRPWSGVVETYL